MVAKRHYQFKTKLWLYPGDTAWHFLTIPKKESALIKEAFKNVTRGWGSLPVVVTIKKTTWKTSIFPDKRSGTFLLPVKVAVRRAEDLYVGDTVAYKITIDC